MIHHGAYLCRETTAEAQLNQIDHIIIFLKTTHPITAINR